MTPVIGLVVNPIAGMGGSVGLKGTDGQRILERARVLGAIPHATDRAAATLQVVARSGRACRLLTCAGAMGEDAALAAGFVPEVVYRPADAGATTSADTRAATAALVAAGVDLLVFAGGDGTARDIAATVGESVPVAGIPAGVKIHSACYAVNPRAAGDLVAGVLRGGVGRTREAEVIDVDEDAYRDGRLETHLFGVVRVPDDARLLQAGKVRSRSEDASADSLAAAVAASMEPGVLYALGPGTTTRRIARRLGFEGTLLGVDLVRDGRLIAADVGERELLEALGVESSAVQGGAPTAPASAVPGVEEAAPASAVQGGPPTAPAPAVRAVIIVTPTGGQGSLLGRGNQQLSARVIRAVGTKAVRIVATPDKLAALGGRPLLVDTGDEALDADLAGHLPVMTAAGRHAMYPVAAPRG